MPQLNLLTPVDLM